VARALRGVASGVGRVARLALGTGARHEDLQQELLVTSEEARTGAKKQVQLIRGSSCDEVMVTIPPGVRSGTRLRLRGKGLVGKSGQSGDLYLDIRVAG
jgi:curved DNA-binding protein